jgi:hypothetical protein
MKYLLLLLLPAVSYGQQKKAPDHNVRSSLIHWVAYKEGDSTLDFSIEYCKLRPTLNKERWPVYDVTKHFYAYTRKDTVIIDPTGLDTLIKGANYIKIAGKVFKKNP